MFTNNNENNKLKEFPASSLAPIMTAIEVAEFLRVHRSTVTRLAMSGALKSYKIGNRRLFKASDVCAFFDKQIVSYEPEQSDKMCSYSGKE